MTGFGKSFIEMYTVVHQTFLQDAPNKHQINHGKSISHDELLCTTLPPGLVL